jgi:hypothetical protein
VMLAPILLILAFYLSKIRGKNLRNGILATTVGYSLLLLFLNERPYYTQITSYREIAEEAKIINNDAPVLFLSKERYYFSYYLAQNKFTKSRIYFDPFAILVSEQSPSEYFVFLDLRHIPKRYKNTIPTVNGYQKFDSTTFTNMNNIKTTRLIQYRKVKDSL